MEARLSVLSAFLYLFFLLCATEPLTNMPSIFPSGFASLSATLPSSARGQPDDDQYSRFTTINRRT